MKNFKILLINEGTKEKTYTCLDNVESYCYYMAYFKAVKVDGTVLSFEWNDKKELFICKAKGGYIYAKEEFFIDFLARYNIITIITDTTENLSHYGEIIEKY